MPAYGLGLVPLSLPSCPSHQSPSGEIRENKQLLPHVIRWLSTAVSSKLVPQSAPVYSAHQERRAEANSKLAKTLMALPGQPTMGALDLLPVQSLDSLRCGWLKVTRMRAELPTSHMLEDHLSVPDGLGIFRKVILQVGLEAQSGALQQVSCLSIIAPSGIEFLLPSRHCVRQTARVFSCNHTHPKRQVLLS